MVHKYCYYRILKTPKRQTFPFLKLKSLNPHPNLPGILMQDRYIIILPLVKATKTHKKTHLGAQFFAIFRSIFLTPVETIKINIIYAQRQ